MVSICQATGLDKTPVRILLRQRTGRIEFKDTPAAREKKRAEKKHRTPSKRR